MTKVVDIMPIERFDATVRLPGSKSYTNRALLLAALAEGESTLRNPLHSEDTQYMVQALREFGIDIEQKENEWVVAGQGGRIESPSGEINVGNAGTAMRFLASLAALAPDETYLTGDARMQERPIGELIHGLQKLGVKAWCERNNGCPPIIVDGPGIPGGQCELEGSISSQYFSSLLMCAPYAEHEVTINVRGQQASRPYIDMTRQSMQQFGVAFENRNYQQYYIPVGKRYQALRYDIEPDATNASYFMAMAAVTGGQVRLENIPDQSLQGDFRFAEVLQQMGCTIRRENNQLEVIGPDVLQAIEIDMNAMPDVVPTLAVVAACAKGKTKITNVPNLRIKECDRIAALSQELHKVGITAKEHKDGLTIEGGQVRGAILDTHHDHRMAMAFAVLDMKFPGIKIRNPEVVGKSFPTFWELLHDLGLQIVVTDSHEGGE